MKRFSSGCRRCRNCCWSSITSQADIPSAVLSARRGQADRVVAGPPGVQYFRPHLRMGSRRGINIVVLRNVVAGDDIASLAVSVRNCS